MSFVLSMANSPAGVSVLQAFARVQEVREEKVEDRYTHEKKDYSPFALAYLTRAAFFDAFLTNAAVVPDRVFHVLTAAVLSLCCDSEFNEFFVTRLAEVAMTIVAIFIAFVGMISPDSAVVVTRSLLVEALADDQTRDLDKKLLVNTFVATQLESLSKRLEGVRLIANA